jgi:hypothetical protein
MLTLDQVMAGFLVLLGLFAGLATLAKPLAGMVILIIQYLSKLFSGPIDIRSGMFWSRSKKK